MYKGQPHQVPGKIPMMEKHLSVLYLLWFGKGAICTRDMVIGWEYPHIWQTTPLSQYLPVRRLVTPSVV